MKNEEQIFTIDNVPNGLHLPIKITKTNFFRALVFKLMELGWVASIGECKTQVCLKHKVHDISYIYMSDKGIELSINHKQSQKMKKCVTEYTDIGLKDILKTICERLQININGGVI